MKGSKKKNFSLERKITILQNTLNKINNSNETKDFRNWTVNRTVNRTVKDSISAKDIELLLLILHDERITITDMAKQMGVSRSTMALTIKRLQEIGCLHRNGSDKSGCWEVLIE